MAPQSVTEYPTSKSTTTQHRQKPICTDDNNSSNSTWMEKGYKNRFREVDQKMDTHISLSGYNQQRVYYRTGKVINNTTEGGQPQLNQISSSSGAKGKRVSFGTVQIRTYETIIWYVISYNVMVLFVVVLLSFYNSYVSLSTHEK